MSPIKKLSLALVMGAATITGANAADAISYPTSVSAEPVPVYDNPGFDWTGFYAGVFGATQRNSAGWEYGAGVAAGANVQFDYFLLGGEVAFEGLTNGTTSRGYLQGTGRAGVVVTDDLLIYAAGGYGGDMATGDRHWLAGGGVEYAVTDNVSLRGQYLHGFAANAGATDIDQVTAGAFFHF